MTYLGPLSYPLSQLKVGPLLCSENRWPGSRLRVIKELEKSRDIFSVRHELTKSEGV